MNRLLEAGTSLSIAAGCFQTFDFRKYLHETEDLQTFLTWPSVIVPHFFGDRKG